MKFADERGLECLQIDIWGKHSRNRRVRPQRRFTRPRLEHWIVVGICQRNRAGTEMFENLFDSLNIQRAEVHYKLAP